LQMEAFGHTASVAMLARFIFDGRWAVGLHIMSDLDFLTSPDTALFFEDGYYIHILSQYWRNPCLHYDDVLILTIVAMCYLCLYCSCIVSANYFDSYNWSN
jgi:hypothetical protein